MKVRVIVCKVRHEPYTTYIDTANIPKFVGEDVTGRKLKEEDGVQIGVLYSKSATEKNKSVARIKGDCIIAAMRDGEFTDLTRKQIFELKKEVMQRWKE